MPYVKAKPRKHKCAVCRDPFLGRAGARYCSGRCRMRALRDRRKS